MKIPGYKRNQSKNEFSVSGDLLAGYFAISIFVVGSILWAATLPLDSATIAQGVVGVDGNRKLVQHLEGGVVEKINIKEGDFVEAGQVLITLQKQQLDGNYKSIKEKILFTRARIIRWTHEKNKQTQLSFDELVREMEIPTDHQSLIIQREVFESRQNLLTQQINSYRQQVSRANSEISGDKSRLDALQSRRSFIQKELNDYTSYEKKGLVTRSRLFSLRNQLSDIDVSTNDTRAQIVVTHEKIDQYRSSISELYAKRQQEASENVDRLMDELSALTQRFQTVNVKLRRTKIIAPISGYVVNLNIHTETGVIRAGESLLEIVPSESALVITARINPKDRDSVQVGQEADVLFSAFSRRTTLPVKGLVKNISADGILDLVNQQSYYEARIELIEKTAETTETGKIFPGMQAEVVIITGNRTLMDYIISPISRSFNLALREQ